LFHDAPPAAPEEPHMPSATHAETEMPRLDLLGDDLLVTTPNQCRLALTRPFLGVVVYALAAYAGL
jgi:hypothetical protein